MKDLMKTQTKEKFEHQVGDIGDLLDENFDILVGVVCRRLNNGCFFIGLKTMVRI